MSSAFLEHAKELEPMLVELRRDLHLNPELGNHLPDTQQKVLKALEGLPLEITPGKSLSSVTAVLRGDLEGPAVLLRGDMDGLPVTEQTGLDYASTNGAMHACGHDLHTAGLVGAAHLLSARKASLAGSVVFMFQPGEEGPGGAEPMIEEGVLTASGEEAIAAYGIHVMPGIPGEFRLRQGTGMAGANRLDITFRGRGGHASRPDLAADPITPLAQFTTALQGMLVRSYNPFETVVATITQVQAGEAFNIIPEEAHLSASVRTLTRESGDQFGRTVEELAQSIANTNGVEASVDWIPFYPPTINDQDETHFTKNTLEAFYGSERVVVDEEPMMGAEDFAFVLEKVPGTFFFLGASPEHVDLSTAAYNHSPHVLFDDAVLADQASALAELAFQRLQLEATGTSKTITGATA